MAPIHRSRTARSLSPILLTVALLLSGCLGPVDGDATTDASSTTIEHAAGETEVPGTPEDVVALEWNLVENLLGLGIQPTGVADPDGYRNWVNADPTLSGDVTSVGTRQEPNLETIASLEPDLILGVEFRHAEVYEQLSDIAPTVLVDPYPSEDGPDQYERVMANFELVAEAVDRTQQAATVRAELNTTFDRAQTQLAQGNASEHPIVLAQTFTQEGSPTIRLFTGNALAVQLVERIGLESAWDGEFERYGFSTVGLEALERVEEASFLYVAQPDDDPINGTYSDDPAWQNLTFVQEDRVYPLGADVWLFGGPLSAAYAVDAIVDALTAEEGSA